MAGEIVTSCPLCLALSDPADMLDIEIDRIVPRGRAHVLLCRGCGSAVVRAMAQAGEPLARELIELDKKEAVQPPESEDALKDPLHPFSEAMTEAPPTKEAPEKAEEPDDGKSAA